MKFSHVLLSALSLSSTVTAAAIPESLTSLSLRSTSDVASILESGNTLEKRKGGGGAGRGGGSSGSSSSSSGSSGSSSGSSGSKGGSSSGSSSKGSGSTSSTSNTGGSTSRGSGVTPSYGGGRYYAGGATTPYTSGSRSPLGVTPYLVAGGALGVGAFYLHGAYIYPYTHPYNFHNSSSSNSTNTTLPVDCVCARYQECGCEDQTDDAYLSQLVGNGSASDMNSTLARVQNVNGTSTLVVNGTLPNGTTASGGSDSAAGSLRQGLTEMSGWWIIAAGVGYTVWFM